jgi:serine/threonine protein kinase
MQAYLNDRSICNCILAPGWTLGDTKVADRLGQQFGNYRLVSLLGQGGYAEVYLGQHVRFNQQAAKYLEVVVR